MISAVIRYSDDKVSIHSSEAKDVGTKFEKGFYEAFYDSNGNMHISAEKPGELHHPYNTRENELVLKTVEAFFADGVMERVNTLGFMHKLGILLWGRQGTAKTAMLNFIAKKLVEEKGAIVLFANSEGTLAGAIGLAKGIREIQNNPIIFIADEFERYAERNESSMKNLMDGKDSIENMLFLGATNYIDKVPETLRNRPSRFKIVIEFKGITEKSLMMYIIKDISERVKPGLFTKEEVEDAVAPLESATMDELKHICLDKLTDNYIPKGFEKRQIGFNRPKEEGEKEKGWIRFFWGTQQVKQEESSLKTEKADSNIPSEKSREDGEKPVETSV